MPLATLPRPAVPTHPSVPAVPAAPAVPGICQQLEPVTPRLYLPSAQRPVRAKRTTLRIAQKVVPHTHAWAQVAFSLSGVTRLTVTDGAYLVPPSRALWIPAGTEHAITVLEDTTLLTLYLLQDGCSGPGVAPDEQPRWRQCRVLEVSDLLLASVQQMDARPDLDGPIDNSTGTTATLPPELLAREALLSAVVQDELRRARPVRLGIALPQDKRLRQLCEAVIAQPARHATLDGWACKVGASPRTLARLFRDQLGTSFGQWRQQVLLAQALALAARGRPVALIASDLGYASPSAFTAMVRRTVGQPPSRFFATAAAAAR